MPADPDALDDRYRTCQACGILRRRIRIAQLAWFATPNGRRRRVAASPSADREPDERPGAGKRRKSPSTASAISLLSPTRRCRVRRAVGTTFRLISATNAPSGQRGSPVTTRVLFSALLALGSAASTLGCATMKQSDTARTGVEQLLISSAADRALDKIDLRPVSHAKVFLDTKFLDCVDKNYITLSLRQRLMVHGCTLVEKAEDAQVIVEVASGGVGTDRNELFLGTSEIPLPPPSPVAIPRLALLERHRAIGTAKISLLAYDAQTRAPVINNGYALARSDHRTWHVLGLGGVNSGSVHDELAKGAGDVDTLNVTQWMANSTTGLWR